MKSKKCILIIVAAALLVVGVISLAFVLAPPRLTFTVELDGAPLPSDRIPVVKVDGQPFVSGSKVGMGQHAVSVVLANTEPFERTVWVTIGSKNLGALPLVSITGAINVSTFPADCKVTLRQGGKIVGEAVAPAHFNKLLLGGYDLEVEKAGSKEIGHIVVDEKQPKEIEVKLKLGQLALLSVPANSEFTLSGGGRNWDGHLPSVIPDVPVGNYELTVRRKGWELHSELEVQLGKTSSNQTVFTYGTINILSDPVGMNIFSNGVSVGKAPVMLDELRPTNYVISASDGENELSTSISLEPNQPTNHLFTFRYGTVRLISTPPGAAVVRNGKEVGKTPFTLERIPVGDISVDLRLAGYVATNFLLRIIEGATADLAAKLISEKYLQAMKEAREKLVAGQFEDSRKLVAAALEIEPNDLAALTLLDEVVQAPAKAAEAVRAEQANAKARTLASLTWVDFQKVLADCTDTREVQRPVEYQSGQYEMVLNKKGKYEQKWIKTGTYTEMKTYIEATFNEITFSEKYKGKTFGFACPGKWNVSKVEKEGSIILKASGFLESDQIMATPPASNRDALKSLQKGQKVKLKAVIAKYGTSFLARTLYLEDAELVDQ